MSQPVNLNKFRKTKARADNSTRAEANTVKFGRNKAEKQAQESQVKAEAHRLDQHKQNP
ncbi:DUF4169 family protein [uncultured Planktomarina sp.]|uniref:DUF4169 family protein n=1 Tax=uncultured Planktomarina sp. TaxID=1538529 RepID=UPI0032618EC0